MKVSICIPQYNRIQYLIQSLKEIEKQDYAEIEVVVSDDGSTDETEAEIKNLQQIYKYPLLYSKNESNLGYDRNYRRSIELASGDYCLVIGNDDTLYKPDAISHLVRFLNDNDEPEIGFSNYVEDNNRGIVVERAQRTDVLGSGKEVALKYYSCFSFVGGLIYKKSTFSKYNTGKHDGSIYSQIYLGCLMISGGCRLFSIREPLVLKDIQMSGDQQNSYRDTIARKWKDYKVVDGGMPSVINVVLDALKDANALDQQSVYSIFNRIYSLTFPHWILDYKANKAFPEAIGLIVGMNPSRNENFKKLSIINRFRIHGKYFASATIGLVTPAVLFKKYKNKVYKLFKK